MHAHANTATHAPVEGFLIAVNFTLMKWHLCSVEVVLVKANSRIRIQTNPIITLLSTVPSKNLMKISKPI